MKIGLLREYKSPSDNRVALTPIQASALMSKYSFVKVVAESSPDRCYTNEEYLAEGIEVLNDLSDCDVLFGIKEVAKDKLMEGKTYFFFSHVIKMQAYNQAMFKELAAKKITLIDYECIKWENGQRVLGFGRWAGIVGAYNGFRTFGLKTGLFKLKPAHSCLDYTELLMQASAFKLGNIKIAVTGNGRVATGVLEVLRNLRIKEVNPTHYLNNTYTEPVFVHLHSQHLYRHPEFLVWDSKHFYANNHEYVSTFGPYTLVTDLLLHGIYWENDMPTMFTKQDACKNEFNIKVIADISCDVDGSIPITFKATSIADPIIYWNKTTALPENNSLNSTIDIMAVGNLPNELPRDASEAFGEKMLKYTFPEWLNENSMIIQNATILKNGTLTPNYTYLETFLHS